MRQPGIAFGILGSVLIIGSLFVPTSVEASGMGYGDRVANLHGMHLQSLILTAGIGAIICSCILIGFSEIARKLEAISMETIASGRLVRRDSDVQPSGSAQPDEIFETAALNEAEVAICKRYSILPEGSHFRFGKYRFETLDKAVAEAKRVGV